jgi:hypothetical protein
VSVSLPPPTQGDSVFVQNTPPPPALPQPTSLPQPSLTTPTPAVPAPPVRPLQPAAPSMLSGTGFGADNGESYLC